MLDDRKLSVLKAIVTDYVASREPVGSKALVERHDFDVSSATVRNDMAVLEDEGYIMQPHTSAGRIPTDKGYRLFVDKLATIKPLSGAERRAIDTFMTGALDVDDLVTRTVRLLAQLTRQVAIVQYPVERRARLRHIEFVTLTPERMLIIVVTSGGQVDQHVLEVPTDDESWLRGLCRRLNLAVVGKTAPEAAVAAGGLLDELPPPERALAAPIVTVFLEMLGSGEAGQVVVAGVPHLASFGPSFAAGLQPLLEALEEQVVLMRLLGEASGDADVTVRIGEENTAVAGLQSTSLVAAHYGSNGQLAAGLGVVGPTRMDYPSTIASVRAVARYVSRFLEG
ncbi:MAG: heat-inducible transcriptional repressor HrcA [Arachnia sp.]